MKPVLQSTPMWDDGMLFADFYVEDLVFSFQAIFLLQSVRDGCIYSPEDQFCRGQQKHNFINY